MKFCTQCGAQIGENVKFCTQCGAPADISPQAPEPQPFDQPPQYGQPPQDFVPPQQYGQAQQQYGQVPPYGQPPMYEPVPPIGAVKPKSKKKWIILAVIGAAVIALGVLAALYFTSPQTLDEWLSFGEKCLLDMDYEQAIVAFENAIEIEPRNVEARIGLAEAYIATDRVDDAVDMLLEAFDLEPDDGDVINAMLDTAERLMELEEFDAAETLYEELIGTGEPDVFTALQDLYEIREDDDKMADLLNDMRERDLTEYIVFGEVSGRVVDAAYDTPLANADVTFARPGYGRHVLTDGDGMFALYLRAESHDMLAESIEYMPYAQSIEVIANETTYLPTVGLAPINENGTEVTVSGRIIDSLTGQGVPDAEITIYRQNAQSNETAQVLYSGTDGYYEFSRGAGYYHISVSAGGYNNTSRDITVAGEYDMTNIDLALTPELNEGEIRIVLTWGASPNDLDSHLFGPTANGGEFHIFYSETETYDNGNRAAFLDLDDTSSYGPETTTIYGALQGTYSFVIYDYSNGRDYDSTALANSGANIKVYSGSDAVREYNVPPNIIGDTWYVFDIVNGEITAPSSAEWDWSY